MIKQLCDLHNALTGFRVQLRFGRLSRAPLRLLRLEWNSGHIECDWVARAQDEWDKDLPRPLSDTNVSLQALEDAIDVRELLFYTIPDISSATLRVYRQSGEEPGRIDHCRHRQQTGGGTLDCPVPCDAGKAVWISLLSG